MERRQKLLISTLTSVFLALGCFLLILAISNDFRKSWDLTADARHSFSQQTADYVSGLDQPVKLYACVDPNGSSDTIEEILERYKKLSPRYFSYEIFDLQKKPTLAETLQIRSYGQGVLEKVEELPEGEIPRRERILSFDEASLTNGLSKLLRQEQKSVYFVIGHGERRPDQQDPEHMGNFRDSLRTEGYDAKVLNLAESAKVPEDATLLVMAGPTGNLLDKEKQLLDEYLLKQGKLFFMADIQTPPAYVTWLKQYGFELGDSIIIDESSAQAGAEPVIPIGLVYSPDHPISRSFLTATAFAMARPIEPGTVTQAGLSGNVTILVSTNNTAYLLPLKEILSGKEVSFSAEGKQPGAYNLAAAALYSPADKRLEPSPSPSPAEPETPKLSSRIALASSAKTFSNEYLGFAGNRDFALNVVNWLAESENQITVRPKDPNIQPISLSGQTQLWLYFAFCVLIPFLSMLTGLLISYYRRKGPKV